MRALLLVAALAVGCAVPTKETRIQRDLNAGVAACLDLLADASVPAEPEARAWCERLARGCREE